jgi:ubiquinone/menaquinone biosynthesis C-methylase UbiE
MILRFLHWLASHATIYNWIQVAAGVRHIDARVAQQVRGIAPARYVLDLGGGTGRLRRLWPDSVRYVCLDIEFPKLTGFRKATRGLALQGDMTAMPVADGTMDLVVCTLVSHHLNERELRLALNEAGRVLAPSGRYIFLDGLRRRDRAISKALWSLDRGAHPYTAEELRQILDRHFEVVHWERFTVYHEYALAVLRKRE